MREIGYRVKLSPEYADEFVERYKALFGAMELKVNEDILEYLTPEKVVHLERLFSNAFSFHIPKNTFYELRDYELTCRFFKECIGKQGSSAILVTHFQYNETMRDEYLCELFYENRAEMALENVEMCGDFFGYLDDLRQIAEEYDFLVCLDIGHLFYSALKSEVPLQHLIEYFAGDDWWRTNVIEFHLHDYNEERCHLNLGSGLMNWEVLRKFLKLFDDTCPIIIETTVEDLSVQGIQEVEFLKERIGEVENP